MTPRDVLEHNLERLLKRAWQPVLPRASFRAQLEREVLARVRPHTPERRVLRPVRAPRGVWIVAAAAALLALVAAIALRGTGKPLGLEALLARGEVAMREPAGKGEWRALEGGEVALGAVELELRTPAAASARLQLGGGAALELGPASRLEAEPDTRDAARVALAAGSLSVQTPAGARLRLETSEGNLVLEGGALVLAYGRDEGVIEVLAGLSRGVLEVAGERLEAPAELRLRAGRLVRRVTLVASASDATRAAVPAPAATRPEEPAADAALAGRVLLAREGAEPAPAALIELFLLRQVTLPNVAEPKFHRFESASGQFALQDVQAGLYRLFVRAPGFATWRRDDLQIGAEPLRLEIVLTPGAELAGIAVDSETGAPLANVLVVSEDDTPVQVLALDGDEVSDWVRSARTGADGGFRLEHVSPGSHFVRASGGGRSVGWARPLDLREGEVRDGLRIALEAAGAIAGRVEDERGRPAEGVVLIASLVDFGTGRRVLTYQSGYTDAEGNYRIEGLPPGTLTLLRFSPEQQMQDMVFVQVKAGEDARQDFLARRSGLELSGRVLRADRAPIAGRMLWIAPASAAGEAEELAWVSTSTDEQGVYKFLGLEAGVHELYLGGRGPADMSLVGSVEVSPGGPTAHDVIAPAGVLRGRVSAAGGEPAAFAVLVVWRRDAQERFIGKYFCDERGSYEIAFLEPGAYALEAHPTRPGLAMQRLDWLTLAAGEVRENLDIALPAGGGVEVEVVAGEGEPVAGAQLRFRSPEGRWVQLGPGTSADDSGRYAANGMAPGRWTLLVSAQGCLDFETILDVQAGPAARLRVTLERAR